MANIKTRRGKGKMYLYMEVRHMKCSTVLLNVDKRRESMKGKKVRIKDMSLECTSAETDVGGL